MTYEEMLSRVKPIPEVAEAVTKLIDSREDTYLEIGGESWYETVAGEKVIFLDPSEVSDDIEYTQDDEDELIQRISGMPIITLYFYLIGNHSWWLSLWIEIPCDSEVKDTPSPYTLFRQSTFAPLFNEKYEVDRIVSVERYIGMDTEMAISLISYYIRYYDYESKIPECIR